jgi:mRNA-degrading endonuclease YafQ of YafQ-DinJ toxin-antitoxin module
LDEYRTLTLSPKFLQMLISKEFNQSEGKRFLKALDLLDRNETAASLKVHELKGELAGIWSASASDSLRITFIRRPGGEKAILTCSHHYDD